MSEATAELDRLELKYDGPDVEDHSIDVRDLAPSLLALADLFAVAHRLAGDGVTEAPSLDVHANGEGSFLVELLVYFKQGTDAAADLFTTRNVVAAVTALQLTDYVRHALHWTVLRFRNGAEREVISDAPAPGMIRVEWENGERIEAPVEAQALVASMDFNRTAGRVFEPLRKPGLDYMELRRTGAGAPSVRVQAGEVGAFNTLEPDDEIISDNERRITISIDNLAFKPGNKWKVNDGGPPFWASVADLDFLQRFTAGEELFGNGDSLVVRMRDVQLRAPSGQVRMEHYIVEVIQHLRRESDDPMEFDT